MPLIQWVIQNLDVIGVVVTPVVLGGGGGSPQLRTHHIEQRFRIRHQVRPVITIIVGAPMQVLVGTRYRITAGFLSGDRPIDPNHVSLVITVPGAETRTLDFKVSPEVQRASIGAYTYEAVADNPGDVVYRWVSDAPGQEAVAEGTLAVLDVTDMTTVGAVDDAWFDTLHESLASKISQITLQLRSAITAVINKVNQEENIDEDPDAWVQNLRESLMAQLDGITQLD